MKPTENTSCKYHQVCQRDFNGFDCTGLNEHCCIYKQYAEGLDVDQTGIGAMVLTPMDRLLRGEG